MHTYPSSPESSEPASAQLRGDAAALDAARRLSSSELLAGQREIEIEHEGQLYRLRLTAQGKLILTK